jgi:hypothetical protein
MALEATRFLGVSFASAMPALNCVIKSKNHRKTIPTNSAEEPKKSATTGKAGGLLCVNRSKRLKTVGRLKATHNMQNIDETFFVSQPFWYSNRIFL